MRLMRTTINNRPATVPSSEIQNPSVRSCWTSRRSAGAQRDAHGHLTTTRGRPREQEPGDVGAGNRQDEANDDEQHGKEGADGREVAELLR